MEALPKQSYRVELNLNNYSALNWMHREQLRRAAPRVQVGFKGEGVLDL